MRFLHGAGIPQLLKSIIWYGPKIIEISEDSPCLNVFTDFKIHRPLVIESSTRAYLVEELMLKAHVRLKLVVEKDGHFLHGYTYQHCLVIDTNSNRVRGLISVSDIARRLKFESITRQALPSYIFK
jgi:hypothetical protein